MKLIFRKYKGLQAEIAQQSFSTVNVEFAPKGFSVRPNSGVVDPADQYRNRIAVITSLPSRSQGGTPFVISTAAWSPPMAFEWKFAGEGAPALRPQHKWPLLHPV